MGGIEFNNGFITAIALFLEHKNFTDQVIRARDTGNVTCDLRLYGASDHLYDMEVPSDLSKKNKALVNRIIKFRAKCFEHRLDRLKDTNLTDSLFTEAEDILAEVDRLIFKTDKVVMNYR